jgi:hypothetical protein
MFVYFIIKYPKKTKHFQQINNPKYLHTLLKCRFYLANKENKVYQ